MVKFNVAAFLLMAAAISAETGASAQNNREQIGDNLRAIISESDMDRADRIADLITRVTPQEVTEEGVAPENQDTLRQEATEGEDIPQIEQEAEPIVTRPLTESEKFELVSGYLPRAPAFSSPEYGLDQDNAEINYFLQKASDPVSTSEISEMNEEIMPAWRPEYVFVHKAKQTYINGDLAAIAVIQVSLLGGSSTERDMIPAGSIVSATVNDVEIKATVLKDTLLEFGSFSLEVRYSEDAKNDGCGVQSLSNCFASSGILTVHFPGGGSNMYEVINVFII